MKSPHHPSIEKLRNWFHVGTVAFVIAVSIGMQLLLDRYANARAQTYLAGFRVNAELKSRQIDLRFRLLADHVQRMRALAEQAYDEPNLIPAPALIPSLREEVIVGYELPHRPDEHATQRGNILAHTANDNAQLKRERDVAWSLFLPMVAQHRLDDALRWSAIVSFHSGNWAAYPYQSVADFLQGSNEGNIRGALFDQYQRPFFLSLRETLTQHNLVWRSPSLDQAGAGYIVSIFAPVYHHNQLTAYVLADVRLQFLVDLLRADLPDNMHIEILTKDNELIADSDGSHPTDFRSTKFYSEQKRPPIDAQASPPDWQLDDTHYRLKLPLDSVRWDTSVVIEQSQIEKLIATDIQPLRQFQVFLIAVMLLVWWLLSRFFVTPSLLLADMASQQLLSSEPRLPRIWRDVKIHLRKLIVERRIALRTLQREREQLEMQVRDRTRELRNQNTELEAFNFAVSHDLRAPLRAISGFTSALQEDSAAKLSPEEARYLQRINTGVVRMEQLIEALLSLSRLSRVELTREPLDLTALANEIASELLSHAADEKRPNSHLFDIAPNLHVNADKHLIRAVLENLLGNAWKYSQKAEQPHIRFFTEQHHDETVYVVADNGAGFDMTYAERLFTPFQRMHRQDEFEGTGIGLSTVQRIIHRHGGRIWAEAEVGKGATFRFTLS